MIDNYDLQKLKEFISNNYSFNISRTIIAHPFVLHSLCKATCFLDGIYINITIGQRLWHIRNDVFELQHCKNCGDVPARYIRGKKGGYVTCSKKCEKEYRVKSHLKTCTKIYGSHSSKSDVVKNRIIKTNEERFNGKISFADPSIKKKADKTMIDLYGSINPAHSDILNRKRIETCKIKYNSDHFISSVDGIKKSIDGMNKNWGMHHSKTDHFKDTVKITMNERYGAGNIMQTDSGKEKVLASHIASINKFFNGIGYNVKNIINGTLNIDHNDHNFDIDTKLLSLRRARHHEICTVCNPVNKNYSGAEKELLDFVKSVYDGEIVENSKKLIPPYEVDIYLPKLKLAFEYNGLYWHSNVFKSKDYHKTKTRLCKKIGVQLIYVWEDDWLYKQDIIKSIIRGMVNKFKPLHARKCDVKEIDHKTASTFLQENHMQGDCISSISYGLYFNNELIQLMSFKKSDGMSFELNRFCNKLNSSVTGGASKLFFQFIKKNKFSYITTFCDVSMFNGSLYEKLGFTYAYTTEPIRCYVDQKNIIRLHRRTARKLDKGDMLKAYNSGLSKYFFIKTITDVDIDKIKNLSENNCYVASEVYYHLTGKNRGFNPKRTIHEGIPHWYLQKDDEVVDITADQFKTTPEYLDGINCNFLSVIPSNKSLKIIDEILSIYLYCYE